MTRKSLAPAPRAVILTLSLTVLAACSRQAEHCLVVEVVDHDRPVAGAQVTLRSIPEDIALQWQTSAAEGVVRFSGLAEQPVTVEVLYIGAENSAEHGAEHGGFVARRIEASELGARVRIDLGDPSARTEVVRTWPRSTGPGADCSHIRFAYGQAELDRDRRQQVLLEIDYLSALAPPVLAVETTGGRLDLQQIFAEVGLELEVVVDDQIPSQLVGHDRWPGEQRLRQVMARYQSLSPAPGAWSLYLLLIPQRDPSFELSCLLDPETRSGAVVSIPSQPVHPGAILHAVGHELGHLLNLPHPWDSYGNTRSLMSYPWRWLDWDWNDPAVYHFDPAGRHHILRAPEILVRPGAGPFCAFGLRDAS